MKLKLEFSDSILYQLCVFLCIVTQYMLTKIKRRQTEGKPEVTWASLPFKNLNDNRDSSTISELSIYSKTCIIC